MRKTYKPFAGGCENYVLGYFKFIGKELTDEQKKKIKLDCKKTERETKRRLREMGVIS